MTKIFKLLEQKLRRAYKRKQLSAAGLTLNDDGAILITGGLGDLIVTARFLRDLMNAVGGGSYNIFYSSPALVEMVFSGVPGFKKAYPARFYKYAGMVSLYCLKINQFVYVDKWPDVRALVANDPKIFELVRILENYEKEIEPLEIVRENHPFLDGELGRYSKIKGQCRNSFLHYSAGIKYGGDALPLQMDDGLVGTLGLVPGNYVTIHNGYDEAMQTLPNSTATKAYHGWPDVISDLKSMFGDDIRFVQIGTAKTSNPIQSADLNLLGKTSLKQALGLIANAAFHLDNEGGFVHVAAAFGKKSCVVFGPTPVDYFSYPSNLNFSPLQCGDCWWSEKTWMMKCPRGDLVPVCMSSYSPDTLAQKIFNWSRHQVPAVFD